MNSGVICMPPALQTTAKMSFVLLASHILHTRSIARSHASHGSHPKIRCKRSIKNLFLSFAIALKTRSGPLFHLPALLYPELCELIGHLISCLMPGDISFADQLSQGLLDPVSQVRESANQDMLGQMSGLCHARLLAQFNENSPFEVGYHA